MSETKEIPLPASTVPEPVPPPEAEVEEAIPQAPEAGLGAEAPPPAPETPQAVEGLEDVDLLEPLGRVRLARMEIVGFKSFCERTEIEFPPGITAIVGPNGCGKSNIGDALNWVLGEQSPRMLRGKRMEDVIFAGTEGRRPLGMAEVSVQLVAGDDAGGETAYELTRRLYRSGESEYLLNGRRARLKDLQQLLRRARVGVKTYATIEQGKIDQILNARPKDRRLIIEDAAGVSGFKHKRRLAELKLEATQANLLRVQDVLAEVRRQINALKRQAQRARRYQRLKEALRARQAVTFARRALDAADALAAIRRSETEAREREGGLAAELARMDAEIESLRQRLDEGERAYQETARTFHRLEGLVEREEDRIRVCREKIEETQEALAKLGEEAEVLAARKVELEQALHRHAAASDENRQAMERVERKAEAAERALAEARERVRALRAEAESLRERLFQAMHVAAENRNARRALEEAAGRRLQERRRLGEELEGLATELETNRTDLEKTRSDLEGLDEELEAAEGAFVRASDDARQARRRYDEATEAFAQAREAARGAAAHLRTLEDLESRFAGLSGGLRALLAEGGSAGVRVRGVLADLLEVPEALEPAVEAALHDLLAAALVDDAADVLRARDALARRGAGRVRLAALDDLPPGYEAPAFPASLRDDPRVLGPLREHVRARGSLPSHLGRALLDGVVLVDRLETALDLAPAYPGFHWVSTAGESLDPRGAVEIGGLERGEDGLLAHRRRVERAREAMSRAEVALEEARRGLGEAREGLHRAESGVEGLRKRVQQIRQRRVEAEVRLQRLEEDRERLEHRSRTLAAELEALESGESDAQASLEQAIRDVEEAEAAHGRLEAELAALADTLEQAEQRAQEQAEAWAEARGELMAARQRADAAHRQRAQIEESLSETVRRLEVLHWELEHLRERRREAERLLTLTESELAEHLQERASGEQALGQAQERLRALRERLEALESERRNQAEAFEQARQASRDLEVARIRAESDREHLDQLCVQELNEPADAVLARILAEGLPEGVAEPAQGAGGSDEVAEGEDATAAVERRLRAVELEALDAEIAEIREKLDRLGPVNMMAIEEYSDLEERFRFLTTQKEDLEHSIQSLRETIRRINRTTRERFTAAFEAIRANYQDVFRLLFNGGRADLRLEEGEEDPLEAGVEILAQPPGKRLASVQLLSGGEKAMAAIALLFAIFRYQPSPFCLLDEVDAALDDVNVGRFTRMLREYAAETQFIIVTHNKLTMEVAQRLYGVTMDEPGVSKVVSIELQ